MADPYITPNRSELIDEILFDLRSGKYDDQKIAVRHLVDFFEAARSPITYIPWLLFKSPFLKQHELLELTDLGNQRWNDIFYPLMVETERLSLPRLVEPLVKHLSAYLLKGEYDHVFQIGSGPMEIERQVINKIEQSGNLVHFIGIDLSPHALATAKTNLQQIGVKVEEIEEIDALQRKLDEKPKQIEATLYRGDGVELLEKIRFNRRHLIFHSLFRHHLSLKQKKDFDRLTSDLGVQLIEYDGYRALFPRIFASIGTWGNPVFLSSSVISNCRYDKKREISTRLRNLRYYFPPGSYMTLK